MKIKITVFLAFLFIGFSSNSQTKVGTINSELIISKMPQLKAVQVRLKNYGAKLDSINNIKINDYDSKLKAYNAVVKTLNDADKKTKANEINLLSQDIGKFRQNGSQMMQLRRNELLRPLYNKITELTSVIAKEKGYTQILTLTGNEFAYIDEKFDITKLVLAKLGIKE